MTIKQIITDRQDQSINYYFKDVARLERIPKNEEKDVIKKAQEGDKKAIERLINSNLRFVISIAKQYQGKGLPLVDLIQEGNIGLMESIPKFDSNKGVKFISYAVWWIRQSITKALSSDSRTVRVPSNQINAYNQYLKHQEDANTDCSGIGLLEGAMKMPVSLSAQVGDENSSTYIDILPNNNAENIEEPLNNADRSAMINSWLNALPNRDGDVIRMLYGIGVQSMPLESIGSYFGIGYERVRQIQKKTLEKLKDKYSNVNDLFCL